LANAFPKDYEFGKHASSVSIAPIPEIASSLIKTDFFSFSHFENLYYGCIGGKIRKESE